MVTAHLGWHIKLTIIACKEDRQFPNLVARIVSVCTQWRKHEVDCSIFSYPLNISWSTSNSSHNMEPRKPQKCIHIHTYEHPCPPSIWMFPVVNELRNIIKSIVIHRLGFMFSYVSIGLNAENIKNPPPTFQNLEVELQFSYLLVFLGVDSEVGFHSSCANSSFQQWRQQSGVERGYYVSLPSPYFIMWVPQYFHFYSQI